MSADGQQPRRRRSDQRRRRFIESLPERWYRDVWLFVITIVVLITVAATVKLVNDIQDSRRDNVQVACEHDNAQNRAIVTVLRVSGGNLERRVESGEISQSEAQRARRQLAAAIRTFPLIQDCAAYARQATKAGR